MVNCGGLQHYVLSRYSQESKSAIYNLELIEHTYKLFKIETKHMIAPVRLFISYKNINNEGEAERKFERDLLIFYSFSNHDPEEG